MLSHWLNSRAFFSPPNAPSWRLAPFPGGADSYAESYRYDEVWPWPPDVLAAMSDACVRAGGALLDLGGGTGNVAEALVTRGHRVTLVDRSNRMLARAREKRMLLSVEERSRYSIEAGDFRTLERSDTFPCIYAVGGPTTFLDDEAEILHFLRKVYRWLEPGGHFYLDFFSLAYWESFPGWKTGKWQFWFERATATGPLRTWVKTYPDTKANRVVFEYSMSSRRWPLRFYHDVERVCFFPEEKWRSLLDSAGFTILKRFGHWADEPDTCERPIGDDINLITLKSRKG